MFGVQRELEWQRRAIIMGGKKLLPNVLPQSIEGKVSCTSTFHSPHHSHQSLDDASHWLSQLEAKLQSSSSEFVLQQEREKQKMDEGENVRWRITTTDVKIIYKSYGAVGLF